MTREEAIKWLKIKRECYDYEGMSCEKPMDAGLKIGCGYCEEAIDMAIEALSADAIQGWIPLSYDDYGLVTDFPHERDGEWVIVTDGKNISIERIKKDAYDHFFPGGRWFELEDVIAWMPLPKPYREDGENDGED